MRPQIPQMTAVERMARAAEKRAAILSFLATGEVWTTAEIAALVAGTSRRRALDTLAAMERDALIAGEALTYAGKPLTLYGITAHGCAVADAFDCPHFEKGRTNPSWIEHRLCTQRMRLAAEAAGWRGWYGERVMRIRASKEGWKKVPDALAETPDGEMVAVEIERHCKTPKRYGELILAYLQEIKAGRYSQVHFVCPAGVETLVQKAMARVTHIKHLGERVEVTPAHRARFRYANFNHWPEVAHG